MTKILYWDPRFLARDPDRLDVPVEVASSLVRTGTAAAFDPAEAGALATGGALDPGGLVEVVIESGALRRLRRIVLPAAAATIAVAAGIAASVGSPIASVPPLPTPLSIGGTLTAATVGTSPAFTPTIAGGTAPYALAVLAKNSDNSDSILPPGRAIGTNADALKVVGGYATAGTYRYTLRATDAAGATADLVVGPVVVAAASLAMPSGLIADWNAATMPAQADGSSVSTWTDSVGGIPLSQATGAAQPKYRTGGIGGKPTLEFSGAQVLSAGNTTNAVNVAMATANHTIIIVYSDPAPAGSGHGMLMAAQASGGGYFLTDDGKASGRKAGYWGGGLGNAKTAISDTGLLTQCVTGSRPNGSTTGRAFINGTCYHSGMTPRASAALEIGGWSAALNTFSFSGRIARVLAFNRSISAAEVARVEKIVRDERGVAYPWAGAPFRVFHGDSQTEDTNILGPDDRWVRKVAAANGYKFGQWTNLGDSGQTWNALNTQAANDLDGLVAEISVPLHLVVGEYFNQAKNVTAANVANVTGPSVNYLNSRITAGWRTGSNRILFWTSLDAADGTAQYSEDTRAAYNAFWDTAANRTGKMDGYVPVHTDPSIGIATACPNASPFTPYFDTTAFHLAAAGAAVMAGLMGPPVAALAPTGPAQNWRMAPTAASDSANDASLVSALTSSGDKTSFPSFAVPNGASRTITLDIPAVSDLGGLAYFIATQAVTVTAERSTDGGATYSALAYTPQVPSGEDMARRGQFIALPAAGASKLRLAFANASGASVTINLKLHQRPAAGRADAWMVNGASLERGDLDSLDMWSPWRSQFSASDPIFFTYAVGGASPSQVRSFTAASITGVPVADYFLLDVGGNQVTSARPYANDPSPNDSNYGQMIDAVQGAGKIALPTRLTYRNYLTPNAVNGAGNQENGSLPYNLNVYDGLIQTKFAAAYDTTYLIPRMDWYSLTLRYREELADEVHHTDALKVRSRALWSDVYGRYVYQGTWPVALVEQLVAASEAGKTDLNYSRAKEAVSSLPASSGKTALLNRLAALTSAPVNTVAPTLSGTFAVGETVSGMPGTWTGFPSPVFTYQWFADGAAITGATAASYLLTTNETGKVVKRRTTATNDAGTAFADSPNSAAVAASSGNDPLTTAYLARMTAQPSSAKISKIDTLMKVLKNLNRDSFVMYAMHDRQAALLDWFRDSYNHAEAGTTPLAFVADQGFTGAGAATGYIRTQKGAATFGNMSRDSASIGLGIRTLGSGAMIGRLSSGATIWAQAPSTARLNGLTSVTYAWTTGNFVMTRSNASDFTITRDQEARASFAASSEAIDATEIVIHRANTSYGSSQITHFHAGPALTVDQEHTLNAAIVAFLA